MYKRQSKDTSMDENKYIELTKTQMEKAIPGITFSEQGKRTIAGQEFYELPYSLSFIHICERRLFGRKNDLRRNQRSTCVFP